ncbi:hypothetical protein Ocin01_14909 [Orchesella cincta]|uniref:Uncharacterized protein n=1 Tax=Orchesella cincta TaxID=48709 RepID=A0A1D2MFM9_ORCCI|nr:hypothetical protein Ocin01_14909 [Orchesella cincta]
MFGAQATLQFNCVYFYAAKNQD